MVQIPEDLTRDKKVAVGLGDGSLRIVNLTKREVETSLRHDDLEAIVGLGFDCQGRMISGGGQTVKIWEEPAASGLGDDGDSDEESDDDDSDDSDGSGDAIPSKGNSKRRANKDSDSDDSDSDDGQKRKRKRKKGKGGKVDLGPLGAHGILKFKGLD
ncbi:hypothetical protein O1611_g10588 [Lasiodiplodia mahajangana]|uniref:Uncharacterized protein n=1 Tax=Lasiodiplodia mahajangana TaxID=1108764 RepID=A0ACC2IWS1_9PEZI|nr:hypothetical protein O1611_g10588 [Lasiodiplodia mahajangana]